MKWLTMVVIGWFLQSCTTFEDRPDNSAALLSTPTQWQVQGRIGVQVDGQSDNAGFEVAFKDKQYQLTLTAALGLGKMVIKTDKQGVLVDNQRTNLTFEAWMMREMGWYFPLDDLADIVFNPSFSSPNWRLKIVSRGAHNLPKSVRLTHKTQAIKIKLLFKNITFNQR